MDPAQIPEDTIICLLCRGTVTYTVDDDVLFFRHLKLEHSVHYDHQFLLAVNFFDEDSKKMVVKNFDDISEKKRQEILMKETKDTSVRSMEEDMEEFIDEEVNDESRMKEYKDTLELEENKTDEKNGSSNLNVESRKNQTCPICAYTMPSGGNLNRHMKKRHPEVNPEELNSSTVPEEEDSENINVSTTLNEMKEKLNDNQYQCFQCKAEFSNPSKLNKHKHNTKHQIFPPQNEAAADLNVKMEMAENKSNNEDLPNANNVSNFGQHFLSNTMESTPESVSCELCNKAFRTKKLLSKHISTAHTLKPFSCEDCPKTFVDELNLRRHVFQYHPESLKKSQEVKVKAENLHERINEVLGDDDIIDKEPDLNELINEVKQELKNINESSGDAATGKSRKESFSFQSILANAIASEPKDGADGIVNETNQEVMMNEPQEEDSVFNEQKEGSVTCNECDKVFNSHHSLKRHKVIHTGEKPFACNLCDNAFSQKGNLKRHMNSYHK